MLTIKKIWRCKGFTLVELMIGITLSTFLLAGLITMFVNNINHHQKALQTARLNQQLSSVLQIMADDIRRAGYWSNASNDTGTHQNNNPFMVSGSTDISVNGSNNCILFTYDHNNTGSLPAISSASDDDRYGFRLNGGVVQTRPPGGTFSCTATDWENMTDSNIITITALTFTLTTTTYTTGPSTRGMRMRSVDISITGQLVSDSSITKTLTQHVKVQNDKFIP